MHHRARTLSLLIAVAALAACHHRELAGHRPVGDGNRGLRAAFDADVDKVRVVMLVAPD